MDIKRIRKDFPILETGVIFLDSAATSLTPEQVVNAQNEYYHEFNANIARGVYEFSTIATERYEEAHGTIAKFLGAKDNEIIITKNSTESINQVAHSFPWGARKKIVTTLIEHHSNYLPWLRVAQIYGLEVVTVKPNEEGIFNLKDFEDAIDSNTALVAVNHVSNVLGTINTVDEIIEIAHRKGAKVIVDGAQAAPHIPVDLHKMDADFYVTSGHKMLGPTGTG
ncbi:MAG TPA: aminotransferase class V-fold PLP-dependent enzyme, partial [candidate division WOR-3 bacterium]|nr:aminotransferase class V-fold PLP-dependent enzyme [candidate division WOR-3 bacterium]